MTNIIEEGETGTVPARPVSLGLGDHKRIISLTMNPSESVHINCPSCGESLEIAIDVSVGPQDYLEDCQVCCQPIRFRIRVSADGQLSIDVRREDESY